MLIGNGQYKIEADEENVIVFRRGNRKRGEHVGEEVWMPLAYYNTLPGAIRGIADMEINKTGLKEAKAISAKIEELYQWIEEAK